MTTSIGSGFERKYTTSVEITSSELQTLRNLISSAKMRCKDKPQDAEIVNELESLSDKLYKLGLSRIDIKWV